MTSPIVVLGAKLAGTILVFAIVTVASAVAARIVAHRFGRNRPERRAIYTAVGASSLMSAACVTWLLLHRIAV